MGVKRCQGRAICESVTVACWTDLVGEWSLIRELEVAARGSNATHLHALEVEQIVTPRTSIQARRQQLRRRVYGGCLHG